MKLRLNKNKGMVVLMTTTLALIAGVATTPAAFAHTQRYIVGYNDGTHQAAIDYEAGQHANASCPTRDDGSSHTPNYCAGYLDGYRTQWMGMYRNDPHNNKQTIEQGSSVNIKGNNNRVVVTQQANTGAQQPIAGYPVYSNDGGKHSSSSSGGSQSNPRCLLLCANVRIN